jgi:acetyl-CoA carboxylase carboxyl transferase subunit alpha
MNETAAKIMKMTPPDLKSLGVIDSVVPEPKGGAHRNLEQAASNLKAALLIQLNELSNSTAEKLVKERHAKFRKMGEKSIKENQQANL